MPHFLSPKLKSRIYAAWYRLQFFLDFRSVTRILRYRKIRRTYYYAFWLDAAQNVGAEVKDSSFGFTEIIKDGCSTFVRDYEMMFDSHLMLELMGNKVMTYRLLLELDAPVIPHARFSMSTLDIADQFLQQHRQVVVKPSSGTGGGRGVTTGITTGKQLKAAARLASRFDSDLLIERQVEGHSFRLLFLDGEFIDAIRRDPPLVIGDGKSTVAQLVKAENFRRETDPQTRALSPLVIDRDARNWMNSQGIKLSSVPAVNEVVQVKRATNENNSSGNVNVTAAVSKDIVLECANLVRQIGVKFAGVDLICDDISGPFSFPNCFVGEINTTPGLHHHYLIANPEAGNPVAEIALRYLFEHQAGISRSDKKKMQLSAPAMHLEKPEEYGLTSEKAEPLPTSGH
ncbi:MAG: cyanophycin synthetase [Pseudomonadota bacterium]